MTMNQQSFGDLEYANRRQRTKREEFLDAMEMIVPWKHWIELIRPHYYNNKRGRPPIGIETMLRMYLLQNWFQLSDIGIEDAIYDSYAMRRFMRIDFMHNQVPDSTTLLGFRHLLEQHKIGEQIFEDIKNRLEQAGLIMHGGSIVDATIISAPSSTKNREKKRDSEMHQTKKGNQWHYGMKVHIGTDAGTGYVHSISGTSANIHDLDEASKLIREDDNVVYGDSGYTGIQNRDEIQNDEHLSKVDFRIAKRPSSRKTTAKYRGINWEKQIEHQKSSVRCKVEHVFLIVKRYFGYCKVSYRGITKNMNRFYVLFASANLVMCLRAGRTKEFCMV